jgi:Protein of unknown function (DUF1826)
MSAPVRAAPPATLPSVRTRSFADTPQLLQSVWSAAELEGVSGSGTPLGVWRRGMSSGLAAFLKAACMHGIVAVSLQVEAGAPELGAAAAALPTEPEREAFIEDVRTLLRLCARLLDAPTLRMDLHTVECSAGAELQWTGTRPGLLCVYAGPALSLSLPGIPEAPGCTLERFDVAFRTGERPRTSVCLRSACPGRRLLLHATDAGACLPRAASSSPAGRRRRAAPDVP